MIKFISIILSVIFISSPSFGQEKTEMAIKITKDGELVKDTTYIFDNNDNAEHVLHMMEMMTSGNIDMGHMKEMHKKMMKGDADCKGDMKMLSDDENGAGNIYIDESGENVKVIIKNIESDKGENDVSFSKKVVVIKDGVEQEIDDKDVEIIIIKKKNISDDNDEKIEGSTDGSKKAEKKKPGKKKEEY